LWHLYNRGVEPREVFLCDVDCTRFLQLIAQAAQNFQWRIHTYMLMIHHYHLFSRYIVLNPVRVGMVRTAGEWPWSSYRATAGLDAIPSWLEVQRIPELFDLPNEANAMRPYRELVATGQGQKAEPGRIFVQDCTSAVSRSSPGSRS
jgi:hypothetical protein